MKNFIYLFAATPHEWTTVNDKNGCRFGGDENRIFLPASGYREHHSNGGVSRQGQIGYYWSSTAYDGTSGHHLYFYSSGVYPSNSDNYATGCTVRCVLQ